MTMPRTDVHRSGAIVPADYDYLFSFNLATTHEGWPVPSIGINCELDGQTTDTNGKTVNGRHFREDHMCCVVSMRSHGIRFAGHGSPGQCTACGARFVYGDVWMHRATQTAVFLGHDCAEKYRMLADRSAHEMALLRARRDASLSKKRAEREARREDFLAQHPGLSAALETDHPIVRDIRTRFVEFLSLSDRQVALVLKLAAEAASPPPPAEEHVDAPEGKQTFRGTVVSVKSQETDYGVTLRMTVKMTERDGRTWLAWGTCPAAIASADESGPLRGCIVEVTATLRRGRDPHFAMMSRPRGIIVAVPATGEHRDARMERRAREDHEGLPEKEWRVSP